MAEFLNIPNISQVIQQAVAPVFLLTGIGSILSVLLNRLVRIVDRSRFFSESAVERSELFDKEIETLSHRAKWIHRAITLCTVSALCICLSIAALFIGAELKYDFSRAVSVLFVGAMLTLISGLICFLREISLSTTTIESINPKKLNHDKLS